MQMMFLGCGAADYDWSKYGEDGVLGSTATLLDNSVLIDCGPTVARAMERFNVSYDNVKAIVNTHNHIDHLDKEQVRLISGKRNIDFYGSPEACASVEDFCKVHPLTFGNEFTVNGIDFLALPSNHAVENIYEETFNYLIKSDRTLLYALDTAWMLTKARRLIGETHIDTIVWDATMSEPGNFRIFEHSDPEMFNSMRKVLQSTGNIDENVKVYFNHRARTLWPACLAEQKAIADKYGAILSIEGETVTV